MLRALSLAAALLWRLRGYEPQPVTPASLLRWLSQYPAGTRLPLLAVLSRVQFISKKQVVRALYRLNEEILARLEKDGIGVRNVIYVALDSAGSSSGVVLNLLRDHANLERRKANFVHSRDVTRLQELTKELGRGALIYVDDFAGSGKQFMRNRMHSVDYVIGSFAEFFLVSCICEEAQAKLTDAGIEVVADVYHSKLERPLHSESAPFPFKEELVAMCLKRHGRGGLGFDGLATSVVLYRNAPNSTPLLLRGNLEQGPLRGIVPRYDDLPLGGSAGRT